MKTKKLLLLVASFMLFALTTQAQTLEPYSYTFTNVSGGCEIKYSLNGNIYYNYSPSSFSDYGTLGPGSKKSNQTSAYGIGEVSIRIESQGGNFSFSGLTTRTQVENHYYVCSTYDPNWDYILACYRTGNHWDLDFHKVIKGYRPW